MILMEATRQNQGLFSGRRDDEPEDGKFLLQHLNNKDFRRVLICIVAVFSVVL